MNRDYGPLLDEISAAYTVSAPASARLQTRASQCLVDGVSHALRGSAPFPPRIVSMRGAWLEDADGHRILDFWQGHLGNILGHNPEVVTRVLADAFARGFGLHAGFTDPLQTELAEIICRQTGAERVRFTTSGSLATMCAIMLARAFTGRDLVLKVGGGWHGSQPWGLKGVGFQTGEPDGFDHLESEGLPAGIDHEVILTRFNDPESLEQQFRQYGDRVACFIVEPFVGAGGIIAGQPEYLRTARQLTRKYGALLIFDEVIAGFRFRAGDVGRLYGITPDLATFGKIIGGGMPVAAVAGRADVLDLTGRAGGGRVGFSGGTYSAHPASMLAAKTLLNYLVAREDEVYARLAALGERMRAVLETAFTEEGIPARCTGYPNAAIPGSSLGMVHFPHRVDIPLDSPSVVLNPNLCDVALNHAVLPPLLLLQGVNIVHGHGAVSSAHTESDLEFLAQACRQAARRVRLYWDAQGWGP
jgi:glutamate-1-semialdehyde 2,1-aminomutase